MQGKLENKKFHSEYRITSYRHLILDVFSNVCDRNYFSMVSHITCFHSLIKLIGVKGGG